MSITEAREKCKSLILRAPRDVLLLTILLLSVSLSFGLGYLTGKDSVSFTAGQGSGAPIENSLVVARTSEYVVASRGGTRFYFQHCALANRISDANKIWFVSAAAASAAGYTLAANCERP